MNMRELNDLFKATDALVKVFGATPYFLQAYADRRLNIGAAIRKEFDVEKSSYLPLSTELLSTSNSMAFELKMWIAENYEFPKQ